MELCGILLENNSIHYPIGIHWIICDSRNCNISEYVLPVTVLFCDNFFFLLPTRHSLWISTVTTSVILIMSFVIVLPISCDCDYSRACPNIHSPISVQNHLHQIYTFGSFQEIKTFSQQASKMFSEFPHNITISNSELENRSTLHGEIVTHLWKFHLHNPYRNAEILGFSHYQNSNSYCNHFIFFEVLHHFPSNTGTFSFEISNHSPPYLEEPEWQVSPHCIILFLYRYLMSNFIILTNILLGI